MKMKNAGDMCNEYKDSLYQCYSKNQCKTLNCSQEFKTYADCVSAYQEKYMPFQ
jgi:hypothetical protein